MSTPALGGLEMLVAHCTRGQARGTPDFSTRGAAMFKCFNSGCDASPYFKHSYITHGFIDKLNCFIITIVILFYLMFKKIIIFICTPKIGIKLLFCTWSRLFSQVYFSEIYFDGQRKHLHFHFTSQRCPRFQFSEINCWLYLQSGREKVLWASFLKGTLCWTWAGG